MSAITAEYVIDVGLDHHWNAHIIEDMHEAIRPGYCIGFAPRKEDILPELLEAVREGDLVAFKEEQTPPPRWYRKEEPIAKPPPEEEQPPGTFDLQVVLDGDGSGVRQLSLGVKTKGEGEFRALRTNGVGSIFVDLVVRGTADVRSDIKGARMDQSAVVVGWGSSPIEKRSGAEAEDSSQIRFLVELEEYRVRDGDTVRTLAARSKRSWEDLAYFNWGTRDAQEIDKWLAADVGCTNWDASGSPRFEASNEPGVIHFPRAFSSNGQATDTQHWLRVKPGPVKKRLDSDFPLTYFVGLARKLNSKDFALWCARIFGFDLEPKHYLALQNDLIGGAFRNPVIQLSTAKRNGHDAWYDNRRGVIGVHQALVDDALGSNEAAWKLLFVLIEEFGHHVDRELRTRYSDVGGDAELDEGARTVYSLVYFDWITESKTSFATYWRGGTRRTLEVEHGGFHQAAQQWATLDRAEQEEKEGTFEYFSAGRGRGAGSFGHQSIEDMLAQFSEKERLFVYFGNWLRDYSQVVDPKLIKAKGEEAQKKQAASSAYPRFKRGTLARAVDYLAREKFGEERDGAGRRLFEVTPERLGVYRPEEHIDNPYMMDGEGRELDAAFRGPCLDENAPELQVDPKTWLKNYIATPGPWATSAGYVNQELERAVTAGRTPEGLRHFGAALHTLEDYYAHSNFLELALREEGKKRGFDDVVAWSSLSKVEGDDGKTVEVYPVGTGIFASLDTVASASILITEPLERMPECKPGERSAQMEIALLLLGDSDLKARKEAEVVLASIEELEKEYPNASTWMCRNVTTLVKSVTTKLALLGHSAENTIDDYQTKTSGPEPENPTHTQLAKDHDDHPLHELAASCAGQLAFTMGRAMVDAWEKRMTLRDLQALAESHFIHPIKLNALLAAPAPGDHLVLDHVRFEFGSATLTADSACAGGSLQKALEWLRKSEVSVEIQGHTDNVSSRAFNLALSRARAESVRAYLVTAGIAPSRLRAQGFAFDVPLVQNTSEANRARNRRVEFLVLGAGRTNDAKAGHEHLRRIQKTISDWVKDPKNRPRIERVQSATFAEDQLKRHKEVTKGLENASKRLTGDNKALDTFFRKLRELEGRK